MAKKHAIECIVPQSRLRSETTAIRKHILTNGYKYSYYIAK
jgi:hypothetical protein